MAIQNKSPEVRFAGFNEDWHKSHLETEVDFFSGLTYSPLNVQINKGTFVIRSSNVKDSELVTADDVFVNSKIVNSANVQKGDIAVVVRNGSRNLIGKHAQIKDDLNDTVIGAFMTGLRPKYNSDFVNALLDTQTFQKEIAKNLGATINQITTGPFKKMEFYFPKPIEQKVVGNFFKDLNISISFSKEKLTKLKNLKKAMLTKMFPQDGASVPEIRFKGFNGDWEEKKLVEIVELGSSKRVHRADYVEFGVPFLRGTEISKLGSASIIEDLLYISEDYYEKLKSNYGVPQIGDILITAVGTLGNAFLIHGNNKFYFKDGNLIWLKNIKISSEYLITFLKNGLGRTRVLESAIGSNQKALTMDKLGDIKIIFPNQQEQQQIGNYFRILNQIIETHNEQLKKLDNIKKACLSKLFVA